MLAPAFQIEADEVDALRRRPTTDLELVIPAFNEEGRIGDTLREHVAFLERQPWRSNIVVVDNGSTDRTSGIVDRLRPSRVPVTVIGASRKGKGAAVRRGMLSTRAQWVGFCDADLATPVETLAPVVELLRVGHPVVIGSRRCEGASYDCEQPLGRRLGSQAFRSLARGVTPGVADTQCGFKFFQADVARSLFAQSHADGFAFDVEIVALARKLGHEVTEVPVRWSDAEGSSFSAFTDGPDALRELLGVRTRLRRALA